MQDIDFYIEKTNSMESTSDGGSLAYHFDDVVLIKYTGNFPREDEEYIMQVANEKNAMGVRTPRHIAIKRVSTEERAICWVLQERAKGLNFREYCNSKNKTVEEQICKQSIIASAPDSHYEKLVADLCNLFDVGLELKPKNIFYDDNVESGGFTFIDLLQLRTPRVFEPSSLKDVLSLFNSMMGIYNSTQAYHGTYVDITVEEEQTSIHLRSKIIQRIFTAMEKVIPNFGQHRRGILRSLNKDDLDFLGSNGTFVGDLSLNEQELLQFDCIIEKIVVDAIDKISTGQNKYWEIGTNEIRNGLLLNGMQDAWMHHCLNTRRIEEFLVAPEGYSYWDPEYSYRSTCERDLNKIVNQIFEARFASLKIDSGNPFLAQARIDFEKAMEYREKIANKHL